LIRVIIASALLAAMIGDPAAAAPIQLNCRAADPLSPERVALEVDIENRRLKFGDSTYVIVQSDDRYLTAIDRRTSKSQAGAEVIVLNRITGDLKGASVTVPVVWHTSGETVARTFAAQCQ